MPINAPLFIALDIIMEHEVTIDFEQHQLTCRKVD